MHTNTRFAAFAFCGVLGSLVIPACELEVTDLNNPALDDLENHPTPVLISSACTGALIGARGNIAAENGLVVQLGILGREAYNFDQADPRYIGELIQGALNPGSPFGGNFWAVPYTNIRLVNVILHALDKVSDAELGPADKSAIRGFVHTIEALDLLQVIVTHDTNGAVIDTDRDPLGPLAPIADRTATYTEIAHLLDTAVSELSVGGDAFPFALSSGFPHDDLNPQNTLDTPKGFSKVNRAIRARVAAYTKDYRGVLDALTMSFLNDGTDPNLPLPIDFDAGVFHTFTTKTGDTTSALINPNIFAHPSLQTDAMKNGTMIDKRFTNKIKILKDPGQAQGLSSNLSFGALYPKPDSPVAMIRNEELILLKAEALFYTAGPGPALTELNIVHTGSGGLLPLTGVPNEATFVEELLYERRYSLMFEWGHRWIDLRRFGRMLPLDNPDDTRNVRYPIALPECNARPGEPACALGST